MTRTLALLALLALASLPVRARGAPRTGAAPAAPRAQPQPATTSGPAAAALTPQQEDMLALATDVARRCEAIIEGWIAAKEVTPDKLFNQLYYPVPDTDPVKFTTDWDRLSDRDIQAVEEEALKRSEAILFVVLVDRNGYLPTHNLRYSQPLTGNRGSDLVNNRTKRMFVDRTGIAAARSAAPYLLQTYARDTGEVALDLSVPVRVQGAHWGAVRVGFRPVDAR
ncbi:MAG: hypothetical protein U0229_01300 [Anaeromyxobacter sp.]